MARLISLIIILQFVGDLTLSQTYLKLNLVCNKTVIVGNEMICITYVTTDYTNLKLNFTSSDQTVIPSQIYTLTSPSFSTGNFIESQIILKGVKNTYGRFVLYVESQGVRASSGANFYHDTWIQDVSCDSNAVAGQYVRFSATVFSLSPNQTSFWISLYPGEIISLTPSEQLNQYGNLNNLAIANREFSADECCHLILLLETEFLIEFYLYAIDVYVTTPGTITFQVVSFDTCGIAITCARYLINNRGSIDLEFMTISQSWSFNVTAGRNTLYLDSPILFSQGSMLALSSFAGNAVPAFKINPTLPDLILNNDDSLSFLTSSNSSFVRAQVAALGANYANAQSLSIRDYFPLSDNYTVMMKSSLNTFEFTQTCQIQVIDQPIIKFICLQYRNFSNAWWSSCSLNYTSNSKLNAQFTYFSSASSSIPVDKQIFETDPTLSYQMFVSYIGVLQIRDPSTIEVLPLDLYLTKNTTQFLLLNTEIPSKTEIFGIQINALISGTVTISFVSFSPCSAGLKCSDYFSLKKYSNLDPPIYLENFNLFLQEGINEINFTSSLVFSSNAMVLVDMEEGVIAASNQSNTRVNANDLAYLWQLDGNVSLVNINQTSKNVYFHVLLLACRYIYTSGPQIFVKQLNISENYTLAAVIYDSITLVPYLTRYLLFKALTTDTTTTALTIPPTVSYTNQTSQPSNNPTGVVQSTSTSRSNSTALTTQMAAQKTTNQTSQMTFAQTTANANITDSSNQTTQKTVYIRTSPSPNSSTIQANQTTQPVSSTRQNPDANNFTTVIMSTANSTQSTSNVFSSALSTSSQYVSAYSSNRNQTASTNESTTNWSSLASTRSSAVVTTNETKFESKFFLSNGSLDWVLVKSVFSNYTADLTGCIVNCSNHGRCILNDKSLLVCACFGSFVGSSCQKNSQPCSSYPCLNGATCIENYDPFMQEYNYSCKCDKYHFGAQCQNSVDLCANKSCSGNGRCVVNASYVPVCQCYQMFSGASCETQSESMKKIKQVISTASIIAILTIVLTYAFVFLMDLHTVLTFPQKFNFNINAKAKSIKPNNAKIETGAENQIRPTSASYTP